MKFNNQQKRIARLFVLLSKVYQKYFHRKVIFKEQVDNGYKALDYFLSNYAYERQGSAAAYPQIARECISYRYNNGNSWEPPTEGDADYLWKEYKNIAKNKFNLVGKNTETGKYEVKVNRLRNPMNNDKGVIYMIALLKVENNIAKYIWDLLNSGKTKDAYDFMKSIRGIGDKISSFYLRDIAYLSSIDEKNISDNHLLQPIDTWLEQAIEIMFNSDANKSLKEKQKLIVDLCKDADVSSIEFNQGAWVLGSQIAKEFKTFKEILTNQNSALSIIKEHIEDKKIYLNEIGNVLKIIHNNRGHK